MHVQLFEARYAHQVATLLNNYLPFEEENENTVSQAGGIQYICIENEEVIGYIAGYLIEDARADFPYFKQELSTLHEAIRKRPTFYTSHLVVNPNFRGRGIGRALVEAYDVAVQQQAQALIAVGWVKSDTKVWDAKKLFSNIGLSRTKYIASYFEPYDVYCPNCDGRCICDADIYYKIYE